MKKIIYLIGIAMVLFASGCNLKTLEPHENPFGKGLNITNTSFRIISSNESTPSIAFSDSQIIIRDMNCYPVTCPSNLCLECRINNESVNFSKWFR